MVYAKIESGEVVEEEVLNGIFTVPYPYVMAVEVAARLLQTLVFSCRALYLYFSTEREKDCRAETQAKTPTPIAILRPCMPKGLAKVGG